MAKNFQECRWRENLNSLVSSQSQKVLIATDDIFRFPFYGAFEVSII